MKTTVEVSSSQERIEQLLAHIHQQESVIVRAVDLCNQIFEEPLAYPDFSLADSACAAEYDLALNAKIEENDQIIEKFTQIMSLQLQLKQAHEQEEGTNPASDDDDAFDTEFNAKVIGSVAMKKLSEDSEHSEDDEVSSEIGDLRFKKVDSFDAYTDTSGFTTPAKSYESLVGLRRMPSRSSGLALSDRSFSPTMSFGSSGDLRNNYGTFQTDSRDDVVRENDSPEQENKTLGSNPVIAVSPHVPEGSPSKQEDEVLEPLPSPIVSPLIAVEEQGGPIPKQVDFLVIPPLLKPVATVLSVSPSVDSKPKESLAVVSFSGPKYGICSTAPSCILSKQNIESKKSGHTGFKIQLGLAMTGIAASGIAFLVGAPYFILAACVLATIFLLASVGYQGYQQGFFARKEAKNIPSNTEGLSYTM